MDNNSGGTESIVGDAAAEPTGVYNDIATRAYSYRAYPAVVNATKAEEQFERAHRYRNRLVEIEQARRRAWVDATTDEGRTAADEHAIAERKAARKFDISGVYWGTSQWVDIAADDAASSTPYRKTSHEGGVIRGDLYRYRRVLAETPAKFDKATKLWTCTAEEYPAIRKLFDAAWAREAYFRRYDGSGAIAVQVQHGITVAELLSCTDTRARLEGEGKRRKLYLRIGSDGRAPVWGVFPIVFHRDLPADARIQNIRVVRRKLATKLMYDAQFMLRTDESKLFSRPTLGTIAVDLGWRRFAGGGGVRVASWADSAGKQGELRLPEELIQRWKKCEDLRSIRDKNFNAARDQLCALRPQLPEALQAETQYVHQWRSPARLASLTWRWRKDPVAAPFTAVLEAWRKQDKHLYTWECNQRENVLLSRREQYRLFARFAAQYATVAVEDMDLRDFAELPEDDEPKDDPQTAGARPNRFKAGLSELRNSMKNAVQRTGGKMLGFDPAMTTQQCSACLKMMKFDAAKNLRHTCEHCGNGADQGGADQDENAARNILRAATCRDGAPGRSLLKKRYFVGESPAEKRRAKGLATRRAKRSKKEY